MPIQPHNFTVAAALASSASGLSVVDTAAAMAAALPNAAFMSRIASFTLDASAALNVASTERLALLGGKLNLGGYSISVHDAAYNLLSAPIAVFAHVSSVTLIGTPTLLVAQYAQLQSLPGFLVDAAAHVTLSDGLAQIAATLASHAGWFTPVAAVSIRLDGSHIGAYAASQLAGLELHGKTVTFTPTAGDATLNVAASAHDLATNATSLNLLSNGAGAQALPVALGFTLTNDGSAISAIDAAALIGLAGFSVATHTLFVADSGANIGAHASALFGHGFAQILVSSGQFGGTAAQLLDGSLHLQPGTTVSLVLSATQTAAQTAALAALPGFTHAVGVTLTVADTQANIIAHAASLHGATSIAVADSAILSAADATTLATVATSFGVAFSLGGHTVTISDTANALLALPQADQALATSIALGTDATVTVASYAALHALPNFTAGSHSIVIADTAANLLALPNANHLTDATVQLSANATVNAVDAQTLAAEHGFSSGSYLLTISDTAAALLALPLSLQLAAGALKLSSDQVVSAAQLNGLATLGIKFSAATHVLTCADTAAHLATLGSNANLSSSQVVDQTAVLSAAAANALAGLPTVSVGVGVTLTVQDSADNLLGLTSQARAVVTGAELPAGAVNLTAAQSAGLHALPHFSAAGTAITVSDTVASLQSGANAGWQSLAATTQIIDTAANLLAGAAGNAMALLLGANMVTISGNAQIGAADASTLVLIPNFSTGNFQLTVLDTAAAIASQASAIGHIAYVAEVSDAAPINVTQADSLAALFAAGKLLFLNGGQPLVHDTYAALTNPANVTGVALAVQLTVIDTAANLIAASSHDWHAVNPNYLLSADNIALSASAAAALAGLGVRFSAGGHNLAVVDGAAAIIANQGSLITLGVTAVVHDTAAHLGADSASLLALHNTLSSVQVTDVTAVDASTAAALSGLSQLLTGPVLAVADNAGNIEANLVSLQGLRAQLAIHLTDSAAAIGLYATDLATLAADLTVTLTDAVPVTASVAASLAPLTSSIMPATLLSVTDVGVAIAANITGLIDLGPRLGTVVLSDGATQSAATAAAMASIDSHLASGVQITVASNAASIDANLAGLQTLLADNRLAGVIDTSDTVADVANHIAALNAINANVTITDSAENVGSGLATLAAAAGLTAITLTDATAMALSVQAVATNAVLLAKIGSPYTIAIHDSSANITSDLISANSTIIANLAHVTNIAANDAGTIVLTQAQALAAHVDDSSTSALALFTGLLDVVGVDVGHLTAVAALAHQAAAISINDNAANIATDLANPNSLIVANQATITHVLVADHGTVTLTASQLLAAGVDDGAQSAIAKMSGGTIAVTDCSLGALSLIAAGAFTLPDTIAVVDSATNISSDLSHATAVLAAYQNQIASVTIADGGAVILTEAQALAASLGGVGSTLSKLTGGTFVVDGVAAADLGVVLGLSGLPETVALADTAQNISTDLTTIIADQAQIVSINVISGVISLTQAQALSAGVADSLTSIMGKVPGHVFTVTGVDVAHLSAVTHLAEAPTHITVVDNSSAISSDLALGNASQIQSALGVTTTISVTGGVLTLTDAQALPLAQASILDPVLAKLAPGIAVNITDVSVADLPTVATINGGHITLAVADTTLAVAADLVSGSSRLLANQSSITAIDLTAGGTVTAGQLTAMATYTGLHAGSALIVVSDGAAAIAALGLAARDLATSVAVVDVSANLASSLDQLQQGFSGNLSIHLTDSTPAVSVTAATYVQDGLTIDRISGPAVTTVTGNAMEMARLSPHIAADTHIVATMVSDTAYNVVVNITGLLALGPNLSVDLTDATPISASLVVPLLQVANLVGATGVADSGAQIAALVEGGNSGAINFLNAHGAILSRDSTINATDAAALARLTNFTKGTFHLFVLDTAAHLTAPGIGTALSANTLIDSIGLSTSSATVTAAAAIGLFAIHGFNPANGPGTTITVADTAIHIDTNRAGLATIGTGPSGIAGGIVVNGSATITDAMLNDLQSLQATSGTGVSITVRDSAGNLAAAASQASGHSIAPAAWLLSGNATVTETAAAQLGALPHFSTGPYTLTVHLAGDTMISIADANQLGNIGAALTVTGGHLTVHGSVADLTPLNTAALALVSPQVTDTFANIARLPVASALLAGSVAISDAEALNASQVIAFLHLIQTGAGPGIIAANLTFSGNVEAVTDTVSALKVLTADPAWTNTAALHGNFALHATDTIAALTDATNTNFLSQLTATNLADNTITTAANAEHLATLATSIHFNLGVQTLTVTDNPANLLLAENADGLALATAVTLSGASQVTAADAEALLAIPRLTFAAPLHIVDTSANLLDGMLAAAITGSTSTSHIAVALAANELLDAQTAEALVSLPGFADPSHLSISDSASYLLDSNNLTAEQVATAVTLIGDETVSANTVLRLSAVPHFSAGDSTMTLASDDFADGSALKAIADFGSHFSMGGHSITVTENVLTLTASEFTSLQAGNLILGSHVIAADTGDVLSVQATGVAGSTVTVYDAAAHTLSSSHETGGSFVVTAPDQVAGQNFSIAKTTGGIDASPLVLLDAGSLEAVVAATGASFASSGSIEVDSGKYLNLYQTGSSHSSASPCLIYDPLSHTISMEVGNNSPITLITLGTHAPSLDASDIFIKHHS